jgi:hypothetical protein
MCTQAVLTQRRARVKVTWDYDESPLLPGESIELHINLENLNMDGTIFVSLDVHILGVSK